MEHKVGLMFKIQHLMRQEILFITATGGTITTCGNDKIHTFTGPGTFLCSNISATPANNTVVSYMVVAGGGGGGTGWQEVVVVVVLEGFREYKSPVRSLYSKSTLVANAPPNKLQFQLNLIQ